ncbi:hypothetical protein Ciccas_012976 [Cichlidogyrus casuarinus]|uniref:Uncharacterized protein n=1 Tax=Cichlidogyrus casuarinus TaxID=1844966 RepID=A0ABD2PLU3_9PLAT
MLRLAKRNEISNDNHINENSKIREFNCNDDKHKYLSLEQQRLINYAGLQVPKNVHRLNYENRLLLAELKIVKRTLDYPKPAVSPTWNQSVFEKLDESIPAMHKGEIARIPGSDTLLGYGTTPSRCYSRFERQSSIEPSICEDVLKLFDQSNSSLLLTEDMLEPQLKSILKTTKTPIKKQNETLLSPICEKIGQHEETLLLEPPSMFADIPSGSPVEEPKQKPFSIYQDEPKPISSVPFMVYQDPIPQEKAEPLLRSVEKVQKIPLQRSKVAVLPLTYSNKRELLDETTIEMVYSATEVDLDESSIHPFRPSSESTKKFSPMELETDQAPNNLPTMDESSILVFRPKSESTKKLIAFSEPVSQQI